MSKTIDIGDNVYFLNVDQAKLKRLFAILHML